MEKKHHATEKRHAKSFSTQATQPKFTKKVEPLNRNFFSHLMKLETAFYNKQFTASTLDELTQCYAKAVEYYDTIKDEIASYFIFKIQDALATKKSLKLLIEETVKTTEKKNASMSTPGSSPDDGLKKNVSKIYSGEKDLKNEVIQENVNEEESSGDEDDEEDPAVKEFAKKKRAYMQQKNKKAKASFSTMISQKQRFVHFFHKMETHKANQKQDMHTLLNDFSSFAVENDEKIQEDLFRQRDRLKIKIEQRKQKSFMTHTMNSGSYFLTNRSMFNFNFGDGFSKKDMSEINNFEDVLRDLDDVDVNQFEAAGLAETAIDSVIEENVLQEKNNKPKEIIENTPKTKTNPAFKGNSAKYISPIGEALELSPIISATEGEGKPVSSDTADNIAITKALGAQYAKISSEDVKENCS